MPTRRPTARPSHRLVLAATLAATAAACGPAPDSAAWAGTLDTLPNGAVLARSPVTGAWRSGQEWRLVEELRIGSAMDEGPDMFGQVIAIEVDDGGRIYVADQHALEIRVFGPDGRHLLSFGGKGGGPGEFENIGGMGWGPDGHLWVIDQRNSRFTVYDRTGAAVTDHRRPGGLTMMPWPGGFDREGRVYDVGLVAGLEGPFRAGIIRYEYRGDDGIAPRDTFAIPRYEGPGFDLRDNDGHLRIRASIPFAPGLAWHLHDGHVWVGVNDTYRLYRLDFHGDTVRIVERDFTHPTVTAAEKDSAVTALEWFTRQGGRVNRSRIPDTKPAFSAILVDDLGYLWVTPFVARDEPPAVDIFDPEGRYLGRIELAAPLLRAPQTLVRGDRIHTVIRDDLDIQYVARYRIEGRAAGRLARE